MSNLVRYQAYNPDQAAHDAAKVASLSGSSLKEWEQGDNIVRFIPARLDMPSGHLRITALHFVQLPGVEQKIVFACPRVELKDPETGKPCLCPVCAEAERLAKSPNPNDRKRAYQVSASLRVFANVRDRTIADPEQGLRTVAFGKMIHNGLKAIRNSARLGGDYTDPTPNGFDIIINREGTGQNDTKYTVNADRTSSPLDDDPEVINWLIDNQPDLEQHVNPVVPEEILAAFEAVSLRAPYQPQQAERRQTITTTGVPMPSAGPRVGASVVRRPARSAAADATDPSQVEYDDDFNPIPKKRG